MFVVPKQTHGQRQPAILGGNEGDEEGEQGERHPIDKTLVARDGGDT